MMAIYDAATDTIAVADRRLSLREFDDAIAAGRAAEFMLALYTSGNADPNAPDVDADPYPVAHYSGAPQRSPAVARAAWKPSGNPAGFVPPP